MSYDDRPDYSEREWKRKTDMLARIACRALQALEDMGKEDFLLLQDDEVRTWWAAHKEADRRAREAERIKQERKEAKARAMAKLTDEEKILLGLKKR
jgi:hypothetical protein